MRFGLGLRAPLYDDFVAGRVDVDFVEAVSENFMLLGGRPLATLRAVRERYEVALHGVSLSVGSAHGLDADYLRSLRDLVADIDPLFVSDHLCWTRMPGFSSHDLLPLPYTEEVLRLVASHVLEAQEVLGRQILLENPSAYVAFDHSVMSEPEFLAELCARSGCGLLLDVNNVYVSARNIGWDAAAYVGRFPTEHVRQIHLAGHSRTDGMLIDTHDQPVAEAVWELFARALGRCGPVAVMIERDGNIPEAAELAAELGRARALVTAGGSG